MNLAQVHAIAALTAVTRLMSGGLLQMYTGTQPVSPETALSASNTLLATFLFAKPAFGAVNTGINNEQQIATFIPASEIPVTTGTVGFARATIQPSVWATATSYSVGAIVSANGNLYCCLLAGTSAAAGSGPNTASNAVLDGISQPVVWQYLAPATSTTVADFTVGVSNTDIIIGNTLLSPANSVTILEFLLSVPAA